MINTIKNKEGYVVAYIEWQILDKNGQFKNNGDYIYIQNLWVSIQYRRNAIYKLCKQIYEHPYSQKSSKVYWQIVRDPDGNKIIDEEERSHKSKRMSKVFDKEYIYKKIKGVQE